MLRYDLMKLDVYGKSLLEQACFKDVPLDERDLLEGRVTFGRVPESKFDKPDKPYIPIEGTSDGTISEHHGTVAYIDNALQYVHASINRSIVKQSNSRFHTLIKKGKLELFPQDGKENFAVVYFGKRNDKLLSFFEQKPAHMADAFDSDFSSIPRYALIIKRG